ncbi:glycosyltransferase [Rhodovulum sp. YNF3179]|uniref:glycosyltransferase n=1 Tax=Rhodovulum sp. YNF3179 TaxID=3425127 RepID=UPI003D32AA36
MRILVHDYAGHPFQAGLSRELARRGHRVTHAWFAGDPGPKGRLARQPDDPPGLAFRPVTIARPYSKARLLRRLLADRAYGRALADTIRAVAPELVLSGNTPVAAQAGALAAARQGGAGFVHWVQDLQGRAAQRLLAARRPVLGRVAGYALGRWEADQMCRADHVILIDEAFRPAAQAMGVARARTTVIPNWGPLEDVPAVARDAPAVTAWERDRGIGPRPRFLYAGTIGLKHDPAPLAALARALELRDAGHLVVAASGTGVACLERIRCARLHLLPLQPARDFPTMLGAADVLLAMIGPEAADCAVPSKLLSYLCAGRPVVLAAPPDSPAARIVDSAGAGCVVPQGDTRGFTEAALGLARHPAAARRAGASGRAWAERHFAIGPVADSFEAVFRAAAARRGRVA